MKDVDSLFKLFKFTLTIQNNNNATPCLGANADIVLVHQFTSRLRDVTKLPPTPPTIEVEFGHE